jgi:hypothetical protein
MNSPVHPGSDCLEVVWGPIGTVAIEMVDLVAFRNHAKGKLVNQTMQQKRPPVSAPAPGNARIPVSIQPDLE